MRRCFYGSSFVSDRCALREDFSFEGWVFCVCSWCGSFLFLGSSALGEARSSCGRPTGAEQPHASCTRARPAQTQQAAVAGPTQPGSWRQEPSRPSRPHRASPVARPPTRARSRTSGLAQLAGRQRHAQRSRPVPPGEQRAWPGRPTHREQVKLQRRQQIVQVDSR